MKRRRRRGAGIGEEKRGTTTDGRTNRYFRLYGFHLLHRRLIRFDLRRGQRRQTGGKERREEKHGEDMAACQSLSSSGHVKAGTEVGSGAERSWRAPPSRGDRGGRLTGTRSCRKLEYPFSASRSAWIFFDSLLLEARLETRKTEAGSVERESECARGDWHRIGARKGDAFSQRRIAPRARLLSLSLH